MSKSRLNIAGKDVAFMRELPVSMNMAIADIREPEKRQSTYSKTITVPGHKDVNDVFEFAFEMNIDQAIFNPNLATDVEYFVNEVSVFKGKLQLLKVNKKYSGSLIEVTYECSLIGETANIFLDIANLKLTDIDFSDLDHTLTYASGLFTPAVYGEGYVYPYIDYGYSQSLYAATPLLDIWQFERLKPAIFEVEYVRRIFENAGYTWSNSSYFNSFYANHIIIPDVNAGAMKLDDADILSSLFYAGRTSDNTTNLTGTSAGSGFWNYPALGITPVPINIDSSGGFFDNGGNYNTSTGQYIVPIPCYEPVIGYITAELTITPPATTTTKSGNFVFNLTLERSSNGGTSWGTVLTNVCTINVASSTTGGVSVVMPTTADQAGWRYRLSITSSVNQVLYLNGASPVTSGTSSIAFKIKSGTSGSVFYNQITDASLAYGAPVTMNNTIPQDVTQLDFLTSIIKLENLYVDIDKTTPRQYHVMPREEYIDYSNPIDMTHKLDVGKGLEILPMGDLDAKRYAFTYKSDKDHYNKIYEDEFKEVYGTHKQDIENDFIREERKIEVVFSASPAAQSGRGNIVAPRLYTYDETGAQKPLQCNIRRLYYLGMVSCDVHTIFINGANIIGPTNTVNGYNVNTFEYPYCGQASNPITPTWDMSFGIPKALFWNYPGLTYTTLTRYNDRYSKFIEEITDRNSKILKAYFVLNEFDIRTFSFRRPWFVDGSYYLVNKIEDYDPQEPKSIPVELLKLKVGEEFVPSNENPNQQQGRTVPPSYNLNGNVGNVIGGSNNINYGQNSVIIGGSGNSIGGESNF